MSFTILERDAHGFVSAAEWSCDTADCDATISHAEVVVEGRGLEAFGWRALKGTFHCPKHNPDKENKRGN